MPRGPAVILAMSGGVDSSVSAYLLTEKGYNVIGVTFRLWSTDEEETESKINLAAEVCKKLGIKHRVVDLREEFKSEIVDRFAEAYLSGVTPNPCVECNLRIKWRRLWGISVEEGGDFIATGHYARIFYNTKTQRFCIRKAVDSLKDQSYALWRLSQEYLSHTIFPLGELTKVEVQRIAQEKSLVTYKVQESQDICFLPYGDYREFLKKYFPEKVASIKNGELVDDSGNVVGQHTGFYNFTIGQRKGFKRGFKERMYVKAIDPENNRVVITNRKGLATSGLIMKEVNFVSLPQSDQFEGEVKIRYGSRGVKAKAQKVGEDRYEVYFEEPQYGVCPGQSAVFYQGDYLIAGGIIEKPLN